MRFVFINPNRSISKKNIWNEVNLINPPLGLAIPCTALESESYRPEIIGACALNLKTPIILSGINAALGILLALRRSMG